MAEFRRLKTYLWRLLRIPPRIAYALGLGSLIGRHVLLLTTTGRKSGLARVTPLQYQEIDRVFYVGSARGKRSDWYRNILADPKVEVWVKSRRFVGAAEVIEDIERVADYLEIVLERNPSLMGILLQFFGFPRKPNRAQLERYASHRTVVKIHPQKDIT